jgi:hypothetical protein
MTKRLLYSIALVLALATVSFAQSVTVTPNKITYRRPRPISSFKRTFTVTYPRVRAATPALSRKIEAAINPITVLEIKLNEEMRETQWLEEAGYEVTYNKNGILAATLSANGTAAYPDGFERYAVVDTKTGARQRPADVFTDLPGLAAKVKAAQRAEIAGAIVEIKKEDPSTEDPASLFETSDFKVADLGPFMVDDKGVTFIYDYGFPHVIEALQPEGHYAFTWAEIKPFIKTGGLLGRFVR